MKSAHPPQDASKPAQVVLELYITGAMPRSMQAVIDVKRICEHLLKGRYTLKVFDLERNLRLAARRQIFAVPTLIKTQPLPLRRVIGDLADGQKLLAALDLLTLT